MAFSRIKIWMGVPCIRNTKVPVASLVEMAVKKISIKGIQAKYPELTEEDIYEALAFAADTMLKSQEEGNKKNL